jgi:hypothetical protein
MSRWKQPPFRPFDEMLWLARHRSRRGRMTGTLVLKNIREVVAVSAKMIYRNGYQERQHGQAIDVLRRLRARRLKIRPGPSVSPRDDAQMREVEESFPS